MENAAHTREHACSFRNLLRQDTRAEHLSLEAENGDLDFADPASTARFLKSQLAGFRALAAARQGDIWPEEGDLLDDLITNLAADCEDRDLTAPTVATTPIHSGAIAYMVLGSRLGTQVLARSADGLPLPRYFRMDPEPMRWRALTLRLDRLDPASDEAQDILRTTKTAFDLFTRAARAAREK